MQLAFTRATGDEDVKEAQAGSGPARGGRGHPRKPREELTVPAACPGSGWQQGTPAARYNSGLWNGRQSGH